MKKLSLIVIALSLAFSSKAQIKSMIWPEVKPDTGHIYITRPDTMIINGKKWRCAGCLPNIIKVSKDSLAYYIKFGWEPIKH